MDRASINAIGDLLKTIRAPDEASIIVSFGAHAPTPDCRNGHVSATITRGHDTATSEAVSLIDALWLARGKLNEIAAKREAEKAKAA